ncbi:transcriptional regulator ATRX homolog isoform X3 [Aricia agestis]|uniref:transcriptional regulator ATRX homolog isoform X3 n=1 Tax=Aricia agestis TaxID=91739 RepID=UPI001C2054D3|nr:transcriptional regulator ATRX homolog isoform X3 [Aricia agestis]
MADAVPVSDVLCEAMDYLSRLGSNLRTRTESLKDKRISKEKLRNAHAVRKAANKVLLICELSKKSIENVESGVKRVLTHICDNQASEIGGKTKREKSDNTKTEYIVYKSRKLKIKKSVNVKHYMSAKVKAAAMASDFQEKYPVYYDCELYRMRKRKSTILERHRSSKDESEENTSLPECKEVNLSTEKDSVEAQPTANIKTCTDEEPLAEPVEKPCELETKVSPENEVESSSVEPKGTSSKENGDRQDKEMRKSKNNIDETNTQSRESLEEANCHKNKIKKRRLKRIRFIDDSSDTDKETQELNKEIPKTPYPSLDECTVDKDNEISKKNICTVTAGKMDENKSHSENKENSQHNDNPSKKTKLSSDNNTITEKEQEDRDSSVQGTNGPEDVKTETKPLIKCVDISKLLSSPKKNEFSKAVDATLVEISDSDSEVKIVHCKLSKTKDKDKKDRDKKGKSKLKRSKDKQSGTRTDKDEEYWIQKRIEVKEFVPKEFNIKVVKLPKFTDEYLVTQNLKRITQNGKILFECHMEPTVDANKMIEKSKNVTASNDNVKNSLLNDSDSEKSDTEIIKKTKNAIENFLKSSSPRSDKESAPEESQGNGTLQDTEKQKTPEPNSKRKSDDETEIVKSSLMKDSSDENVKGSDEKKRRKSDSITPSKRKHIMESMHAKKMLLTYSSSSETEDEQLKSTLREIRKSLLEETGDVSKKSTDSNKKDEEKKSKHDTEDSDKSEVVENGLSNNIEEENSNSSTKKMSEPNSIVNSSSHNNSDTEDQIEKDIDGLTNLKSLRRTRTRHSRTRRTRSTMPKPQISQEGFLKAESSSEAEASAAESETAEELPAVSIGLNGDGIQHLAKEDLLGDSDSSDTQKDNTASQDNNESSDENLTTKRRKANTISSDDEGGSSKKKDKDVKLSDFEDSEDSGSDRPNKKNKRKKKGSESDGSSSSSVGGSKKKRKRIKNIDDSDGSGSETENEGKNKHGRKNIRKVMGKNQLEEATKKAARQEKERIARIAERQKLYNNLQFDESGKPDEVVLDKVVLDFDPETKEPLIEVDKGLVKKLKPHQANGIKFMWDACFESVKRIKKDKGSGCILAHCMGLGKTLQVVTLTHTLLSHGELTGVRRVLVVCPLSTVLNWVNEFRMWLKHTHNDIDVDVYELSRFKQNSDRARQLTSWFEHGGVCVLGYEMFRNLSADNTKKFKKKMLKNFQESLVDPGPDLVVCDEGHLLKNEKTSLSQAMNRIRTQRRIVLTGTPLQNNLKEYYCMVQFVKPNLLGKYNEYLNRFVNPITNGQYTDSTEHDIKVMKRRSHVLHKMLDGAVQRRDYGVLAPFLPPKHEYVLFITLSEVQIKLYQEYLDNYSRRPLPGKSSGFLFPDFQSLQRIWTHPLVLKYNSERYEIMQQKKREREEEDSEGSLVDFIDDDSTPEESSSEETTDDSSDMSDDSRKKSKKKKSNKKSKGKAGARRGTRANPIDVDEEEHIPEVVETKQDNPTEWWIKLVGDDELDDIRNSHKLVLLFDILRQCEAIGDKLLVFSQSLYSLDLIEHFLGKVDEATQEGRVDEKLNGYVGSWSPGVDYFRLDGSTSCENRSIWCKNFNREDNPRARLFLISTRAGGLGINLVAANRVVIFDVSWNPSHDVQSIFRVYRFGQKKPCYIYRFLAMGTMEEKIYERQVTKQAISKRVIDEQQIDRHYAENDLAELYKFEPKPPAPRELPPLPKDRLFAEMLREHEAQIYKYHEHDSLLENKEEETLSEEERKAAWEDFENEKTRPPPQPFTGYMHNGMMPGLLQQQQLAYATVAAMLKKDMPNINDNQIRDMLPMIYQANPGMFGGYDYGLLQKMSEIYKYAPNMMTQGMMNPMLNAGTKSSGGPPMGMGGSSGLQYDPPWQRQQQQQQQMRLQQMLQHQHQNFYAGGLGSRDPVAMALQQQRAREMMLGERAGAGRPRGRPPARPPPTGDVVNLDSD